MTRNRFAAALIPALMLPALPGLRAQAPEAPRALDPEDLVADELDQQDYEVGESPDRHAQVKVVEGTVTVRKGDAEEALTRGLPLAEGDVVESKGRGVLQLGDGSTVAFGPGTRFRIAALFSGQDEERRVLLVLERGRIRVCKGAQSDASLRVDTPSGSGLLGTRDASRPDATFQVSKDPRGDKVVFLVHGGRGTFTNAEGRAQVYAGQRLTVYGDTDALDRVADFNTYALDDFDQWVGGLVRPRPGESASRVPPEIRYYAEDLDANGKWVYVEDAGAWCWTPAAVDADWSPYCYGHWGAFGGGMTWISDEPWGYVTYHHGRWGWGAGFGWYWIPGIYYSPAWVAWHSTGAWFGWAPLGFRNRPARWDRGPGGRCWNVVDVHHAGDRDLRPWFRRDAAVATAFSRPPEKGQRPWFRGRVIVDRHELADPARFQRVVAQPGLVRERVTVFARETERATGRPILRPAGPARAPQAGAGFTTLERPIQARPAPRTPPAGERTRVERPEAPVLRLEPSKAQEPRQGIPGNERRDAPRREGPVVERADPARVETLRRDPVRVEPPRKDPARTEAPRQEIPRNERRDAPRQEAPRTDRREAPRTERREAPRQESRPAPRTEARSAPRAETKTAAPSNTTKDKK